MRSAIITNLNARQLSRVVNIKKISIQLITECLKSLLTFTFYQSTVNHQPNNLQPSTFNLQPSTFNLQPINLGQKATLREQPLNLQPNNPQSPVMDKPSTQIFGQTPPEVNSASFST
ncbi:hypothetical protein [Moorena sp. SIO4E2]|uniref:hypothetical protein n=1 Tax=Moorena sp. SIO4E2 TaxID=2607826 RepID=UPI00257F55A6|nr:hypothetical protein [Moorena sp. SIO4E2]